MLEPWQGRGCHYSYTDRCYSYTISSLKWDVICCRIARDCVGSYEVYTSYTPPSPARHPDEATPAMQYTYTSQNAPSHVVPCTP